jgi:hypothetical protein
MCQICDGRPQLISGHQSRLRFLAGDVVLRPAFSGNSDDTCHSAADDDPAVQAEERAHSLRMRRCGAVAIFSENDIGDYETGWLYPPAKHSYLFGWPKSGGVWVLRAPLGDPRQEDMEDVCRVLEESGAQFHVLTENYPEAVEFNLVSPAQASTIRLQG